MEKITGGYAEVPHTADWTLRVWAADLNDLYIQAARGMFALMGVERADGEPVNRQVRLWATDFESLLVTFLGDLLFYLEVEDLAFDPVEVRIEDSDMTARLVGLPVKDQRMMIKAATYHRLAVLPSAEGYEVTITFDV